MKDYRHQAEIIKKDPKKTGLFLGTGSGKTRIAVKLSKGQTLVICPKTQTLDGTWTGEWATSKEQNLENLVVLSYEQFKKSFKDNSIWDKVNPSTVILDEVHKACGVTPTTRQKNYVQYPKTSQVFESIKKYLDEVQPERLYLLTATPIPQPMAVWALGILLGKNWDYFKWRMTFYFERNVRGRNLWLVNKTKEKKEYLAKIVNSLGFVGRLDDWFDVPEQNAFAKEVGTTTAMEKAYQELKMLYPDPLVQAGKRHRLEQGIFEDENGNTILLPENKTAYIAERINEFGQVVVFAEYTAQIEMYEKHFKGKVDVVLLTGKTKDRSKEWFKSINDNPNVLFIIQARISYGYEVPDMPCVIFASHSPSFVDWDQALGRVQRAFNIKKNTYISLISGAADEKRYKDVSNKRDFSEATHAEALSKMNKLR